MNKLILVNGDVATGKSHFAIILRDRFNLPLYTKDEFKEALADTYPYSTYEESHALSIMAMDTLISMFIKEAKDNNDLILEANFHEAHLKKIHEIALEYGYKELNLNLTGAPEILFNRYINRRDNENRHPVHRVNNLNNYDDFKKYIEDRKKEKMYGEVININTDDFSYQKDEKLLKKIKLFLEK